MKNKTILPSIFTIIMSFPITPLIAAETIKIDFDHIELFDDSDSDPIDEILLMFALNDKIIFKRHERIGIRITDIPLNFTKKISASDNNTISLKIRGIEYDRFNNRDCRGGAIHQKDDTGNKRLICDKGDIGYYLYYRLSLE